MAVAAAGCGGSDDASDRSGGLLLLAAASTADAATELADLYEARTGEAVRVSTAGSNALASQVIAGVPGDVFLSANPDWAERVVDAGLAEASRPLLSNRLVIVVPTGNPAGVASPSDLLGEGVRRVALAGEGVPAGVYAEQALRGAGVYDALIESGRVARGQDVRLTLTYVETGEAEAGVVYATDARVTSRVEVVHAFSPGSHEPIVYPVVLLNTSARPEAARRLFDWLRSDEAMGVFTAHGFEPAVKEAGGER